MCVCVCVRGAWGEGGDAKGATWPKAQQTFLHVCVQSEIVISAEAFVCAVTFSNTHIWSRTTVVHKSNAPTDGLYTQVSVTSSIWFLVLIAVQILKKFKIHVLFCIINAKNICRPSSTRVQFSVHLLVCFYYMGGVKRVPVL